MIHGTVDQVRDLETPFVVFTFGNKHGAWQRGRWRSRYAASL